MGLYGTRTGILSISTESPAQTQQFQQWLSIFARKIYCSPPKFGAGIVRTVLGDQELRQEWREDVRGMGSRILSMRSALVEGMTSRGNPNDWSHITKQRGMFAFTGISKEQCQRLTDEYKIYLTLNGRISVAGLNPSNIEYFNDCLDIVTRE